MQPTETHRVMNQINKAKAARQHRTLVTIAPERRRAVEWNLQRGGFKVEEYKHDSEMTVISW